MRLASSCIYIIGGCSLAVEKEPISSVERVFLARNASGELEMKSENCGQLAAPKRSPSVFWRESNKEVVVVGGCLGPNNHTNAVEIFQLQNHQWIPKPSSSQCSDEHSCAAFDPMSTKMILFGGFDAHECLNSVQVIDDVTFETRKLRGLLPKLKNSVALEDGGEYILFGGWQDESTTSGVVRRIKFNEDYTSYEVDFEGFLPYPIEAHSLAVHNNKVFLIGGYDGCFLVPTIIRYDLTTRKSEVIDVTLKEKRENHVCGVIGEKYLVVAGGWDSKQAMDSVEIFEILNDPPYLSPCNNIAPIKLTIPRNRPSSIVV